MFLYQLKLKDLSLLIFDRSIGIKPGQFVFAWIPGISEKPFSVLDDNPLTLAVQKRGCFTEELLKSEKGREIYFRGPYGVPLSINEEKIVLVGGGCGIAALFQIARDYKDRDIEMFIGAKDKEHLFYIDKFKAFAKVNIATENGSLGYQGMITDLLKKELKDQSVFFNCGPEPMIEKAVEIEKKYTSLDKIYNSIDYVTKCGVGLCGSCATKNGKRLCVDGPFINL